MQIEMQERGFREPTQRLGGVVLPVGGQASKRLPRISTTKAIDQKACAQQVGIRGKGNKIQE